MRGFLLDTNVVSEPMRPSPVAEVIGFLSQKDPEPMKLSVVTIEELTYGVSLLEVRPERARDLSDAIAHLSHLYRDDILPVTDPIARASGVLRASVKAAGRHLHFADALIAATAIVHELTLATRNTKDFEGLGVALFNPWDGFSA